MAVVRALFTQVRHLGSPFFGGICLGLTLGLLFFPIYDDICPFLHAPVNPSTLASLVGLSSGHGRSLHEIQDDYQPRLLLPKYIKTPKPGQKLLRPRFYSTELGIKDKLFAGVLTDTERLSSLAVGINKTLAHHVDKIVYFLIAQDASEIHLKMPSIVGFTDDRPWALPFNALRYMAENFLDRYSYFFIMKDSTYVRGHWLYNLAERISISQHVYLGLPILDTETDLTYCSLGILVSASVLQSLLAYHDWCLENAQTDSDSANIGLCIQKSFGIQCRDQIQGQIFHSRSYPVDLTKDLENIVKDVVTVSEVSEPLGFYRLHRAVSKLEEREVQGKIKKHEGAIWRAADLSPWGHDAVSWPISHEPQNQPHSRFDVLQWEVFNASHVFEDIESYNIRSLSQLELFDTEDLLNQSIHYMNVNKPRWKYMGLVKGYRRFDPVRGMESLVDLKFLPDTGDPPQILRLEGLRPLGPVEVIPMPFVTETRRVCIISLVDQQNIELAGAFLAEYESQFLKSKGNVFLMMVLIQYLSEQGSKDPFVRVKGNITSLATRYKQHGAKLAWMSLTLPDTIVPVPELGLLDVVLRRYTDDSLILYVGRCLSWEIHADFFNRVRVNTIQGWQVFSPIPYEEYHPDVAYPNRDTPIRLEVSHHAGHFNQHTYEHLSFFKSDYFQGREKMSNVYAVVKSEKELQSRQNFPEVFPHGVLGLFIHYSQLHVLRGAEPSLLVHYTGSKECNSHRNFVDKRQCIRAQPESLGSHSQLAQLIQELRSSSQQPET